MHAHKPKFGPSFFWQIHSQFFSCFFSFTFSLSFFSLYLLWPILPPILHPKLDTFFWNSAARIWSILKMDTRMNGSVLAVLAAVVQCLLLQMSTKVDFRSESVKVFYRFIFRPSNIKPWEDLQYQNWSEYRLTFNVSWERSPGSRGRWVCAFITTGIPCKRTADLENPLFECTWLWLWPQRLPRPLSASSVESFISQRRLLKKTEIESHILQKL